MEYMSYILPRYTAQTMGDRKRSRVDEPEEGIEQRLINLIVRVGDKNTANLSSHLQGLAAALNEDLPSHRQLIIETVFDCARAIHPKSAVYGTLVGLLNLSSSSFGADVVSGAHDELQRALDDHAPHSIRGLVRFMIELMNSRVLAVTAGLELIEALFAVRTEPNVLPARAEWFLVLVVDAIILGGAEFSACAPAELASLLERVGTHVAGRPPLRTTAPLLLPFGIDTAEDETTEQLDALWAVAHRMAANDSWTSACLLQPRRAFKAELADVVPRPLPTLAIPGHTSGCTYPTLRRLRIFRDLPANLAVDGVEDTR